MVLCLACFALASVIGWVAVAMTMTLQSECLKTARLKETDTRDAHRLEHEHLEREHLERERLVECLASSLAALDRPVL